MENIKNNTIRTRELGDRFKVHIISKCCQVLDIKYDNGYDHDETYIDVNIEEYSQPYVEETLRLQIFDKKTNELYEFEADELVGDTEEEHISHCIHRIIKEQNMRLLDHECECGWEGTGKELLRKDEETFICPACGAVIRELW